MIVARTWKRILAYMVDAMFLSICWWPVALFFWQPMLEMESVRVPLEIVFLSVMLVLFYKWMFLYFAGATPGKLLLGLRVVNRWGEQASLGLLQSLLRVVVDGFSFFFGVAPRALALFRFDRTHLSDWIAETQVIQSVAHRSVRKRWGVLAVIVIIFAASNGIKKAYNLVENMGFEAGDVVIAAEFWLAQK